MFKSPSGSYHKLFSSSLPRSGSQSRDRSDIEFTLTQQGLKELPVEDLPEAKSISFNPKVEMSSSVPIEVLTVEEMKSVEGDEKRIRGGVNRPTHVSKKGPKSPKRSVRQSASAPRELSTRAIGTAL